MSPTRMIITWVGPSPASCRLESDDIMRAMNRRLIYESALFTRLPLGGPDKPRLFPLGGGANCSPYHLPTCQPKADGCIETVGCECSR